MYQVITLFGDFEPWWFLEDWKNDITETLEFASFEEAKKAYLEKWQSLREEFPHFESRPEYLATFWDSKEQRWCEECDEDLQQYHSIMLLKDYQVIDQDDHNETLSQANAEPKQPSSCRLTI